MLGICLGMQLLYEASDEGDTRCLGVFPGRVRRMTAAAGAAGAAHGLEPRRREPRACASRRARRRRLRLLRPRLPAPLGADTVASCDYDDAFTAVACRGNFHGAQFHPERSAALGARFLANFLELS